MTQIDVRGLIIETIRAPSEAARRLLTLNLPRQWLWMALALMTVLNAIIYSLSLHSSPPTDPAAMAMIPPAFQSPILFTLFLFGALVITVFVLHWIGQSMGGKAELGDILVLITWLQVMRLVLQIAVVVLSLVSLGLSAVLVLAASIWGIYILASFLNVAHQFNSMGKAIGVMILGVLAIAFGLSLIVSLITVLILGGA